jgi:hypothetical protein
MPVLSPHLTVGIIEGETVSGCLLVLVECIPDPCYK